MKTRLLDCRKKNRKSSEKAIDCTAFLFFGIVYCVDNAGDAGNHGTQNRAAERLIHACADEKTGKPCNGHKKNGYCGSEFFHETPPDCFLLILFYR